MEKPKSYGLGFGSGSIIDCGDGHIEYRATGRILPVFKVNIHDVKGFSTRSVTTQDKKAYGAISAQVIFAIQGNGTVLAEVPVNRGTPEKIEEWFRSRPEFNAPVASESSNTAASSSFIDELERLTKLHEAGALSSEEFALAKQKLLS